MIIASRLFEPEVVSEKMFPFAAVIGFVPLPAVGGVAGIVFETNAVELLYCIACERIPLRVSFIFESVPPFVAPESDVRTIVANMAMIAITTKSSMSVKPFDKLFLLNLEIYFAFCIYVYYTPQENKKTLHNCGVFF